MYAYDIAQTDHDQSFIFIKSRSATEKKKLKIAMHRSRSRDDTFGQMSDKLCGHSGHIGSDINART